MYLYIWYLTEMFWHVGPSRGLEAREKAKKEEEERRKTEAAAKEKMTQMEEAARKKDEEARAKVQREIRAMKEDQGGCMDVDSKAVLMRDH